MSERIHVSESVQKTHVSNGERQTFGPQTPLGCPWDLRRFLNRIHAKVGPTPYRGYCLLMWEYEGGCTLCLLLFNVLVIWLLLFWVGDGWPSSFVITIKKTLTFLDGLGKKETNTLWIVSRPTMSQVLGNLWHSWTDWKTNGQKLAVKKILKLPNTFVHRRGTWWWSAPFWCSFHNFL